MTVIGCYAQGTTNYISVIITDVGITLPMMLLFCTMTLVEDGVTLYVSSKLLTMEILKGDTTADNFGERNLAKGDHIVFGLL